MKYECNWCNHTRPCVVEYSGSNECKPDRCMISPEQAGAFELVEDHECEWERSEILDIELKAAQKNEEAPETIDNTSSPKCSRYFECNNELKHTSSSKYRPSCLIN